MGVCKRKRREDDDARPQPTRSCCPYNLRSRSMSTTTGIPSTQETSPRSLVSGENGENSRRREQGNSAVLRVYCRRWRRHPNQISEVVSSNSPSTSTSSDQLENITIVPEEEEEDAGAPFGFQIGGDHV